LSHGMAAQILWDTNKKCWISLNPVEDSSVFALSLCHELPRIFTNLFLTFCVNP
jgi:hypothetical protein